MPAAKKKKAPARRKSSSARAKAKAKASKRSMLFPIIHTDSQLPRPTWHDVLFSKVIGGGFLLAVLMVGVMGIGLGLIQASNVVSSDKKHVSDLYVPVSMALPEAEKPAPLMVEVRNGTRTSGHASAVASAIQNLGDVTVTGVGNAARFNYSHSIVVDMTEGHELVSTVVKALEAQWLTELPAREEESEADIVVILGQ